MRVPFARRRAPTVAGFGLVLLLGASAAFAQVPPASSPARAPTSQPPGNPASAPVQQPASNAGATERGLDPVQPASGVTQHVRQANQHDTDASGHTVDPHGKPVGQTPAVPSTVR